MIKPLVVIKRAAFAMGHLTIATVGVPISTAIVFFSVKPILAFFVSPLTLAMNLPLRLGLFPLQTAFGLAVGYLVARRQNTFGRDKSAYWVWVIPGIWFLLFFLSWSQPSILAEGRLDRFFWSSSPESKTRQIVTTLPLLTSISYALGVLVGTRRSSSSRQLAVREHP